MTACMLLAACSQEAPVEPAISHNQAVEYVGNTPLPADEKPAAANDDPSNIRPVIVNGSEGAEQSEAPAHVQKAPALRHATPDEIEELNGTFRTPGSRERLLQRIQTVSEQQTKEQLAAPLRKALATLGAEERAELTARLAEVLKGDNQP
jgi:hypothetical protein